MYIILVYYLIQNFLEVFMLAIVVTLLPLLPVTISLISYVKYLI